MPNKRFSERLNGELDDIDVPQSAAERIEAFSKLVKIPKFKAEAILSGATTPDVELLNRIADELEVSSEWLLGKTDNKLQAN